MEIELVCDICQYDFLERPTLIPRYLDCTHTICEECCVKIMKTTSGRGIRCPNCQRMTPVPDGNVNSVKRNTYLVQVIENRRTLEVLDENNNKEGSRRADKCNLDERHTATSHCASCQYDFCENCWKRVHRLSIFGHHEKIAISEKPPPVMKCPIHPCHVAEFFCTSSQCTSEFKIACIVCVRYGEHAAHDTCLLETWYAEKTRKLEESLRVVAENREAIRKNIQTMEDVRITYVEGESEMMNMRNLIEDRCVMNIRHSIIQKERAHQKLKVLAENRLSTIDNLISEQTDRIVEEDSVESSIHDILRLDVQSFASREALVDELIERRVDTKCPTLHSRLHTLQLQLPCAFFTPLNIRPIFRLVAGSIGNSPSDMWTKFFEKSTRPAVSNKHLRVYRSFLVEFVDPDQTFAEGMKSLVFAQVSAEHVQSITNIACKTDKKFEKIIVGIVASPGIERALKLIKCSDARVQFTILTNPTTALEQIMDLAVEFTV